MDWHFHIENQPGIEKVKSCGPDKSYRNTPYGNTLTAIPNLSNPVAGGLKFLDFGIEATEPENCGFDKATISMMEKSAMICN